MLPLAIPVRFRLLGYFVLAGHGVGFTNSQSDVNEFNSFMGQQKFTCVTTSGTAAAVAPKSKTKSANSTDKGPTGEAVIGINPCSASPQ